MIGASTRDIFGEDSQKGVTLQVRRLTEEQAIESLRAQVVESAIGHESTARVLSERLGLIIPVARKNVFLDRGDSALVAQVNLPRLAEGQVLSEDEVRAAPIEFYEVLVD